MEHKTNIKLTTTHTFEVEKEEAKRLYLTLALFQYYWLRTPDYREKYLLELLEKEFKKFYREMQVQTEREPNNLMMARIRTFFDNHYKRLRAMRIDSLPVQSESADA